MASRLTTCILIFLAVIFSFNACPRTKGIKQPAVSATISHPSNSTAKLPHVLVFSCFSYSYCLEVFGVALTLADTGKFEVTLIVLEPCRKVVDRLLQVTLHPENVKIVYVAFDLYVMTQAFNDTKQPGVLSDTRAMELFLTEERRVQMRKLILASDDFLRHDNFSNIVRLHEHHPFDVAICATFSGACFEFADRIGIVGISAGFQGAASHRDLDHNGLWLSGCADRIQRPHSSRFLQCSLGSRLRALYDYYFCAVTEATTLNNWLITGCSPARRDMKAVIDRMASETREDDPSARTRFYPIIDQHILGTTKPPGYYRPDHAVIGPTWFKLQQADLLGNHDSPVLSDLHSWLESANKPVVYVAFGSWARLNVNETRMMLEAIVSDRWLTVWKTNSTNVQLLLNDNSDESLPEKVHSLATDGNALKVLEWAPQFALLQHPKVKAFVTHGGMSSLMEASGSGVPMVCVPLFAEQPYNCEQVAAIGGGVVLNKLQLTSDTLRRAIEMVALNGEKFRAKMQTIAQYHSAVDTTGRLAEFVEHYAKFKYQFLTVADDYFDSITYKNADFWLVLGVAATALCVVVHMACCVLIRATLLLVYGKEKFKEEKLPQTFCMLP